MAEPPPTAGLSEPQLGPSDETGGHPPVRPGGASAARGAPGLFTPIVLLVLLLGLVSAARSFTRGTSAGEVTSGAAMGAGLALLGAIFAGQVFAVLRLPRLTGYLCMGMAIGPEGLDLITRRMLSDLELVNGVAIGLIALNAGLELNFRRMRPRLGTIGAMGGVGLLFGLLVISSVSFAFSSSMPHMGGSLDMGQRLAIALVTGTIYATVSPSVTFAILAETGAQGPVSEVSMGLVVLGDIVLVVGFAAVNAFAAGFFTSSAGPSASLSGILFEILGSLAVGVGIGFLLSLFVKTVAKKTALFAFGLCFLVAEMGTRLHLDPLLVCLAAGLTVENLTSVEGTALGHDLEIAAMPTFAVFFCVAGAGIHLRDFVHVAPFAIGLAALRFAALFVGAKLGGRLSRAEPVVQRYAPFAMLPQAGISIGLAIILSRQFGGTPDRPLWGAKLAELVFGTITVNELIGPFVLKWALGKAGESGRKTAAHGGH